VGDEEAGTAPWLWCGRSVHTDTPPHLRAGGDGLPKGATPSELRRVGSAPARSSREMLPA
jgi:hypothetical protein